MLWNYLKVAYRNLLRHPLYAAINVLGLGIAIAFCLLAFLYVRHEWTYDAFHENADRIYRVYLENMRGRTMMGAPSMLAPTLAEAVPEIRYVRMASEFGFIQHQGEKIAESIKVVDPEIFEIFSFPLLKGDPQTALMDPQSVVITERIAEKYFPAEDPMGKTLSIQVGDGRDWWVRELTVTGLVGPIPRNSSIRFDFLLRLDVVLNEPRWKHRFLNTYFLLPEFVRVPEFERQMEALATVWRTSRYWKTAKLQNLKDIHLDSKGIELQPAGNPVYSYILACIALLVLIVASVNYTNLSVGRSFSRAREVGLRKVAGGLRTQLTTQFLTESVLLTLVALGLGLALAELFMPGFNSLTRNEFSISELMDSTAPVFLIVLLLVVGIVSGSYPALIASRFLPADALKGPMRMERLGRIRRVLVVFQVAISVLLVGCTVVVGRQLNLMTTKPLGFSPKDVFVVRNMDKLQDKGVAGAFQEAAHSYHAVLKTARTGHAFSNLVESIADVKSNGTVLNDVQILDGDLGLLETLDIKLKSGRAFEREGDARTSVLVNEALAEQLGWQAPLGKTLQVGSGRRKYNVIGVVHDFYFHSVHRSVKPAVITLSPRSRRTRMLLVRVRPDDRAGTVRFLKEKWEEMAPGEEFYATFLDDDIDRQYREERRWFRIAGFATFFAVFIACLGAFGLTSLNVARRTKEIGIRKVLGAPTSRIVSLLTREYVILVGIATLIASPVAYVAAERWLQNFAYRVDPGIGTFLLGGLLTLLVVLLAVSLQVARAARANPVDALRYE